MLFRSAKVGFSVKGKNKQMFFIFKMYSYKRTIPKMRCQAYNTLIENPGENNLGALPISLTGKLANI